MTKNTKIVIALVIVAAIIAVACGSYNLLFNRDYDTVEQLLETRLKFEKWQKIIPQNNEFASFSDVVISEGDDMLVFVNSVLEDSYYRLKVYNNGKAVVEVFTKEQGKDDVSPVFSYGKNLTEQEMNLIQTVIAKSDILSADCKKNNPEDFNYSFFINYNGVKKTFENNLCFQEFSVIGDVLP